MTSKSREQDDGAEERPGSWKYRNPAVHSVSQLYMGQLNVLTGQGYAEARPTGHVPLLDSIVWNLAISWSHHTQTGRWA